jgi:hypothetical protein
MVFTDLLARVQSIERYDLADLYDGYLEQFGYILLDLPGDVTKLRDRQMQSG